MQTIPIKVGTTDVSVILRFLDSTDGTPELGVSAATAGLVLEYRRELGDETAITPSNGVALTTAHSDGAFLHIGDGYYRLDVPDAAFASSSGVRGVLIHGVATGMVVIASYVTLTGYDPYDSVRAGLTALPNAAAEAAGGLYTRGSGAGQINQAANGQIDANVVAMSNNVITASAIADGAIDAGAFAADAITAAKIADGAIDAATFATGAINASSIATAAITAAKFGAGAIDAAAIADGAIDAGAFAADAITAAKIADGAIDAATFATGAINASSIATAAITAAKFGAGAIDAAAIATGAIDADALAADAITAAKVAADVSAEIADAVWDEDATGHQTQGAFGQVIGDSVADADSIWGLVNTNLDATMSSRASASALSTVQADTDDIQSRLPAALVGGRIDANVGAINSNATAAANLAKTTAVIGRGTVGTSASTTSVTTSAFSPAGAAADQFKGRIITFDADTTTAALRGQSTDITASSNASTPIFTVTALTTAPASGDTFSVT